MYKCIMYAFMTYNSACFSTTWYHLKRAKKKVRTNGNIPSLHHHLECNVVWTFTPSSYFKSIIITNKENELKDKLGNVHLLRFLLDVLSSVNVLRRTVIESRMTTENRNIEELSRLDKTIERNSERLSAGEKKHISHVLTWVSVQYLTKEKLEK